MIPPNQTAGDAASICKVSIKNARAKSSSRTDCDINDPLLTLRWNGSTAEVRLRFETYLSGQVTQVMFRGVPQQGMDVGSLQALDASRNDLLNLESDGCLTSEEDARLIDALVERFPISPYDAYLFRFGSYGVNGGLDLNSDFRLQIISPVYSDPAPSSDTGATTPASAKQIVGYETAYYLLKSSQNDDRVTISLESVSETDAGKPSPYQKSTTLSVPPFPDSPEYFRLLFRTAVSSADHVATIVSAPNRASLDEAAKQREAGPVESCQGVSAPGATCVTFSAEFGVNPQMRVRINGKESFVGVAGTVREALNLYGPNALAPKTLMVRRLFQGHPIPVEFDPASKDILQFVLMPGDEIRWR